MKRLTFLELKKNCKKDSSELISYNFAVLGDCATQHLATAIKGYAYSQGYSFNIFDADYNQIEAQIIDSQSELYSFAPKSVLIYMCSEKLYEDYCNTELNERDVFAEAVYRKINGYWAIINQRVNVNIIQFTFVMRDDGVFGSYAYRVKESFVFQLQKLNQLVVEGCQKFDNVHIVDLNLIALDTGRSAFCEDRMYYLAKMTISAEGLPVVAKAVIDVINAMCGKIIKCVVLDLDNTLWGGVIGDDGLEGIQIGELGIGHAFTAFQTWLKELKNRGIILAVCSKNDDSIAKEPFVKHPEMVLGLDDISLFVANWEDKASNIKYIQRTLNIGMDTIAFFDDNPFERNLVRTLIPDITIPELPEDPALYVSHLRKLNLFETASYSQEDRMRGDQYRIEAGRIEFQQQFNSFDDYLQGLDMVAQVAAFDKYHYSRIAQLTQRSNQFNLRTIRYSEAEIAKIAENHNYITLYFCLRDKFSDHGLVSVVILEKIDDKELFVDEWLMSCRVLKRGMEEFVINKTIEIAKERGFLKVTGEYLKTVKNAMVEKVYGRLGFTDKGDGIFEADVMNFGYNITHITEVNN